MDDDARPRGSADDAAAVYGIGRRMDPIEAEMQLREWARENVIERMLLKSDRARRSRACSRRSHRTGAGIGEDGSRRQSGMRNAHQR